MKFHNCLHASMYVGVLTTWMTKESQKKESNQVDIHQKEDFFHVKKLKYLKNKDIEKFEVL